MQLVAALVFAEAVDQPLQRALAELGDPHSNGGDPHVARKRDVIEADDRDLFGDPFAGRSKSLERPDGHIVVSGKNGIELNCFREQPADRGLARFHLEVAPDDSALETVSGHSLSKSGLAVLCLDSVCRTPRAAP